MSLYRSLAMRSGDEPHPALACPWCARRATSWRAKATLHPETAIECQWCGRRVSVAAPVLVVVGACMAVGVAAWSVVAASLHAEPIGIVSVGVATLGAAILASHVLLAIVVRRAPLVRR